jgi:NitT/TauT family transport system substrate-binding protein
VDTGGSARDFTWQFFALMNQLGMDVSRMHLVPYDPEYTGFFNGEVDVTPAFSTGGLIKMRKIGFPVNLIWPDDYGIHFFSDTVFTTDQVVADRPDLVLRFLRASLKGWRDVVEDYSKAVDATVKRARIPDPVLQTSMMEAMLPLVHTGEDVIGWMKPERWREMAIHLIRYGMMKDKMEVDSAYTLQFLQEIYPGK